MRFAAQAKVTKSRKAPRTQRLTEIRSRCNLRPLAGMSGAGELAEAEHREADP